MLYHLLEFVISPRTLLTHAIGGGLWVSLARQGSVAPACIAVSVLLSELTTYLLWLVIPNSWATILALGIVLHLYQFVAGPKLTVQRNFTFLADEDVVLTLQNAAPDIRFDTTNCGNGRVVCRTSYSYIVYDPSYTTAAKHDVDLRLVRKAERGCFQNVASILTNAEDPVQTDQCFYVKLAGGATVTVVVDSASTSAQWADALQTIASQRSTDHRNKWLQDFLLDNDLDESEKVITLSRTLSLLERANRPTDKAYAQELVTKFSTKPSSKKYDTNFDKEDVIKLVDFVSKHPEITRIFERQLKKTGGESLMQPSALQKFMREDQQEVVSVEQCRKWITKYEPVAPAYSFTPIGFTNFMLSEDNVIQDRKCREVYQDMNQPLSHYFIATSHNTYLTEGQLHGKSSVDCYVSALKRGCKCLELDCWDGSNNEPVITHGHTLTTKILFKDVIQAIGQYAFHVSKFPVILSFENHCSVEQQKVMANHLVNILGNKLYTKPVPEDETALPSPNDLQGYVIVKAKKRKEMLADGTIPGEEESDDDESGDDDIDDESMEGATLPEGSPLVSESSEVSQEVNGNDPDENAGRAEPEGEELEKDGDQGWSPGLGGAKSKSAMSLDRVTSFLKRPSLKGKKKKVAQVAKELSDLVAYCQAVHFKGFKHSKENGRHYEMSSFAEKKAFAFCLGEERSAFLDYNRRQLSRIYPAGKRVDSSNYDPVPLWSVGCQLVALNYQTGSLPMQLNQGLFSDNGGCGYVLKPDILRLDNSTFDPLGQFPDNQSSVYVIRVLSGLQIPYRSEKQVRTERNLQVYIRVSGVKVDMQKERTRTVKNNGYNPVWDDVIQVKIHVPEVALLQFQVNEDSSTLLGQYTLPVTCLQQGYRRVPLLNKDAKPCPHSSLLVHVQIKNNAVNGL